MPTAFSFQGPARFASVPFVLDIVAPVGGIIATVQNLATGAIRATWSGATDAAAVVFELYAKPDNATGLFDVANICGIFRGTSGTVVTDATGAEFTRGRTYWFGVRAVDAWGNRTGTTTALSIVASGPDFAAVQALLVTIEQDTRADLPAFIAAGLEALNQSAARRIVFATAAAYEIPPTGGYAFTFELRTYDADGNPQNATATPTVVVTYSIATSWAGRTSALTNTATGVYRGTVNVNNADAPAPLRFDASAVMSDGPQSISFFGYVTRQVSVDFTQTDRDTLNGLSTRATEQRLAALEQIAGLPLQTSQQVASDFFAGNYSWDVVGETLIARGLASGETLEQANERIAAIYMDPEWFAQFATLNTGVSEAGPGSVCILSGGAAGESGGSDHPLASNR
jgi:hypothetical protein